LKSIKTIEEESIMYKKIEEKHPPFLLGGDKIAADLERTSVLLRDLATEILKTNHDSKKLNGSRKPIANLLEFAFTKKNTELITLITNLLGQKSDGASLITTIDPRELKRFLEKFILNEISEKGLRCSFLEFYDFLGEEKLKIYIKLFIEKEFIDWAQNFYKKEKRIGTPFVWRKHLKISKELLEEYWQGKSTLLKIDPLLEALGVHLGEALKKGKEELKRKERIKHTQIANSEITKQVKAMNSITEDPLISEAFKVFLKITRQRQGSIFNSTKDFAGHINMSVATFQEIGKEDSARPVAIEKCRRAAFICGHTLEKAVEIGLKIIKERESNAWKLPLAENDVGDKIIEDHFVIQCIEAYLKQIFLDWTKKRDKPAVNGETVSKWLSEIEVGPKLLKDAKKNKSIPLKKAEHLISQAGEFAGFKNCPLEIAVEIGKRIIEKEKAEKAE